jgi:hypothetical protein
VIEVYEGLNEIIRLLAVSVEILGYSDGSPNSCIPLSVTFSRSHATEPVPVLQTCCKNPLTQEDNFYCQVLKVLLRKVFKMFVNHHQPRKAG